MPNSVFFCFNLNYVHFRMIIILFTVLIILFFFCLLFITWVELFHFFFQLISQQIFFTLSNFWFLLLFCLLLSFVTLSAFKTVSFVFLFFHLCSVALWCHDTWLCSVVLTFLHNHHVHVSSVWVWLSCYFHSIVISQTAIFRVEIEVDVNLIGFFVV